MLDRLDDVVARSGATPPTAWSIARLVVFGVIAVILGPMAGIVALIAMIRILAVIPSEVWLPYVVLGAILVGLGCSSGRRQAPTDPTVGRRP